MDRQHPIKPNSARDHETALWLALLNGTRLQRRTAKEVINAWCVRDQRRLVDLLPLPADELSEMLAMPPDIAAQVLSALADASAARLSEMHAQGIEVVTRVDAAFPEELAFNLPEEELPYLLYCYGALEMLSESGVAVGGSHVQQTLDETVLGQLALVLAGAARPAIGGFERGADRELILGTVANGGQAIAILPLGLNQAATVFALAQAAVDSDRLLLLSPFPPETPFSERVAQARLPLVTALASGLVLLDPDTPPDDWPGAGALLSRGAPAIIVSRQDSAVVQQWALLGATIVDGPGAASDLLAGALSSAPREAGAAADELPGVEPIYFENAEEAIQLLGRSGQVPPALARRLRESGAFGYQDVPDVDVDWDATEQN